MDYTNARTVDKLSGYFKTSYLDKKDVRKVLPEVVKLASDIPFSTKNKIGKDLRFPVMFSYEQGFVQGAGSEDILVYNDPVSATSDEAKVEAYQLMLKSVISMKALAHSLTDQQSFERETRHIVENMITSFRKRQEILMLYGKDGLGVVSAKATVSTKTVLTISDASFAPLIFSGMEGAKIDIILANKSDFSDVSAKNLSITSVDIDTQKITLSADVTSVVNVGDHVYFAKNSDTNPDTAAFEAGYREMPGIKYLLTFSGSIWGINNSVRKLWKGTTFDASGGSGTPSPLSFNIIQRAVARGVSKGLDGKARAYISHLHWADLINDETAARRLDSSYDKKKLENGSQAIVFHSQNGEVEIAPHGMVKGGDTFILQLEDWERVGTLEMSFNVVGDETESQIFVELLDRSAYMLGLYSDQVLFCKRPAAQVYVSNLTFTKVDA